jgi:hypothetical protein
MNTNNWGNQKQSFSNTGSCEDHLYLVEICRSKLQTNLYYIQSTVYRPFWTDWKDVSRIWQIV